MKRHNRISKKETIDFVGVDKSFTSVGGRIPSNTSENSKVKNSHIHSRVSAKVFKIPNIENYPKNTVRIYNEENTLVFEVHGYNNKDKIFKGQSYGKVDIPENTVLEEGVYNFVVDYMDSGLFQTTAGYLIING